MNEIFNKGTSNRSIEDIRSMHHIVLKENDILRQSVREYVSRILMDTSEEHPKDVEIMLDNPGYIGICDLQKEWISSIWQDSSEGMIHVLFEDCLVPTDFDYLSTDEQVQILNGLLDD